MPSIDDLVIWSLNSELYQDKLNFYKELIDVYRIEIDIEVNKVKSNDWVIDWQIYGVVGVADVVL